MKVTRYPVLQSGFISLTEIGMTKPERVDQSFSATILGKDTTNAMDDYFYSREVEILMTEWKNDPKVFKPFEFRERIVKTAVKCFGTPSFRHWVELQYYKPSLGRLHKEMLLDTVNFVVLGEPRKVECFQWSRLLFPETGYSHDFADVQSVLTSDIAKHTRYGNLADILPFIHAWVAHPNGYVDLLKTLHAVFGRRMGVGPHQSQ